MANDLTRLLSKGVDYLADGNTLEEYMGQVDITSLSSAEQEELYDLLDTSASLLQLRRIAIPPPRAKAANRARFLSEVVRQREESRRQAARGWLRTPAQWWRGLLRVALSIALLLVMGSGAVSAAAGSLPGSPLYPLKLVVEDVRLTLTFSPPTRAQLYMRFANERTSEMVRLATAGRPVDEAVVGRMAQQLQGAVQAAESAGGDVMRELLELLIETSSAQQEVLSRASSEATAEAQAVLNAGAAIAEQTSRQAQEALQGLPPPTVTPLPTLTLTRTDTPTPVATRRPFVVPVDSPTPTSSHTIMPATPSHTPRSPTPWTTHTRTAAPTPALPATPVPKSTHTPEPTRSPSTTPSPVAPTPTDTKAPSPTPQAVFYLTNEDNPDPVPASYRIHYVVCIVNDGDVPLTGVVITDTWSPECIYLPPPNPSQLTWDIGTVEPHSRRCVLFALSTFSICGGNTVVNEAMMTSDQGSARAVQYTRIIGTPTPSATVTITTTITPTLTLTPTDTAAATGTWTPTVTLTPTGTSQQRSL